VALGPSSAVIDGQRFALPTRYAYQPSSWGPQTSTVPNASPTIPPSFAAMGAAQGPVVSTPGAYGTADSNSALAATAAANPFSLKLSPTLWAVILLLGSIFLLGKIHWSPTG
jgi:hypothetical protein